MELPLQRAKEVDVVEGALESLDRLLERQLEPCAEVIRRLKKNAPAAGLHAQLLSQRCRHERFRLKWRLTLPLRRNEGQDAMPD